MRGLRLSADDPDLGLWTYTYDAAGRLLTQRDARNITATFTYDSLNRLKTRTSPRPAGAGGTDVVTNSYDEPRAGFYNKGHLTSASKTTGGASVASQTFDHDDEGRLRREGWIVGGTDYGFAWTVHAPGGEVLYRIFPDGDWIGSNSNRWTYDLYGRLNSVPAGGGDLDRLRGGWADERDRLSEHRLHPFRL
jgi:YD repeat-containing protein